MLLAPGDDYSYYGNVVVGTTSWTNVLDKTFSKKVTGTAQAVLTPNSSDVGPWWVRVLVDGVEDVLFQYGAVTANIPIVIDFDVFDSKSRVQLQVKRTGGSNISWYGRIQFTREVNDVTMT